MLAWQTGYGGNVDFAGGHPELVTATQPFEDVDVTLRVESASRLAACVAGAGGRGVDPHRGRRGLVPAAPPIGWTAYR